MSIRNEIDLKVKERFRPKVVFGESRTKQAFKDQVNVNKIMKKYQKGQMIDHFTTVQPFYGDVSEIGSYQEALALVMRADELFSAMSSEVRDRFRNDPANMISFLADEKNRDEAVKLGLIRERPGAPKGDENVPGDAGKPK